MADLTPVIIGVGEASERIGDPDYRGLSPAVLAGRASRAALADTLTVGELAPHIDLVAAVRQFEISHARATAPFGRADNFPRAVARRIGADPAHAMLEVVGGQGPQHLVIEMAHRIAAGEIAMALLCGGEAVSTQRHLIGLGETRDWTESADGDLEDRGYGGDLVDATLGLHGARTPINLYALFENARRARLGLGREAYALEMGRLFAPFTRVAARNPHAMSREPMSAEALATVTEANRITSDPFPRRLVSRDQTNQAAAVLMTSVEMARRLGVADDRRVFLLGGADVRERLPMERVDLSRSPAAVLAAKQALNTAGITLEDVDYLDLYSCFPVAVFNLCDGLGLESDDPRGLTVTGGLPYFAGAGNNYSMHAIAEVVRKLRAAPGTTALVSANGGFLSKTSVGVYGTDPTPWRPFDSASLQARIDAWEAPPRDQAPGTGTIETYMIDHGRDPARAVVIGRRQADHARFVAMTTGDRGDLVLEMAAAEPLGAEVGVSTDVQGRLVIDRFVPLTGRVAKAEGRP